MCQARVTRQCRHASAAVQCATGRPQLYADARRLHPCPSDRCDGLGQRVLGWPHHWGGASPRCLSRRCSRLVQRATRRPHLSAEALWPPPDLGHAHPHTSPRAQSCRPPVGPAAARCSSNIHQSGRGVPQCRHRARGQHRVWPAASYIRCYRPATGRCSRCRQVQDNLGLLQAAAVRT